MEPEDFEEMIRRGEQQFQEDLRAERIEEFIGACEEGYKMIEDHGVECVDSKGETDEVKRALNRMLGYFIHLEEYEKCFKIKSVYLEVFRKEPSPEIPNFLI